MVRSQRLQRRETGVHHTPILQNKTWARLHRGARLAYTVESESVVQGMWASLKNDAHYYLLNEGSYNMYKGFSVYQLHYKKKDMTDQKCSS